MKKTARLSAAVLIVAIVAACIIPASGDALTVYDDNHAYIKYVGWYEFAVAAAYGGSVHSAPSPGAVMQATFDDCTEIDIYGGTGTNRGCADIYVDGALRGQIDTYSADMQTNVLLFHIDGLERGTHTVQLIISDHKNEQASDHWLEVDGMASDGIITDKELLIPDPEAGNQITDDDLLEYSGGWTNYTELDEGRGFWRNTASSTTVRGASVSYTFAYCTGIRWYSTANAAYGEAEVYIDGQLVQTVDVGKLPPSAPCAVFDSGELAAGEHTVKIVKTRDDNTYIEVDRLVGVGENAVGYYVVRGTNQSFFRTVGGGVPDTDDGSITLTDEGQELVFTFCGQDAVIYGQPTQGRATVLVDGVSRGELTPGADGMILELHGLAPTAHYVSLVLQAGTLCVQGARTDTPQSVARSLHEQATRELELIRDGKKPILDRSAWHPVKRPATAPVTGVTLTGGVFLDAFNKNIRYLEHCFSRKLYVDMESIWTDELRASTEGRMLAGAGNALRFVENQVLEDILDKLLGDIAARDSGNGWCLPYPESNFAPHPGSMIDEDRNYDRVMFTRGLAAAVKAGREDARTILRNFYDWFDGCDYLPTMLDGGLGIQGSLGTVLAYESPVGKADDLYVNMQYYDMDWWMDSLTAGVPEAIYRFPLNRPHSYLLVGVQALLAEYVATGEQKYLDAVRGAWRIFYDNYKNVGGGICICEGPIYYPRNYTLDPGHGVYENCGNVFWTELNARLLELYPTNETYAAEIEESLYNMLIGSQADDGRIRYFQLYNGQKTQPSAINTCCENMATGQLASLPQYIYSVAADAVYVNLFAASSLRAEAASLTMETDFPNNNEVSITFDEAADTTLYIRIPRWNGGDMDVCLNGQKVDSGEAGTYLALKRRFGKGDTVTFTLSPTVSMHKYAGDSRVAGHDRYAMTYGPILMAAEGRLNFTHTLESGDETRTICLDMTAQVLADSLAQDGLRFTSNALEHVTFVPYMSIENQSFAVFPVFDADGTPAHDTPGTDGATETDAPAETDTPTETDEPATADAPTVPGTVQERDTAGSSDTVGTDTRAARRPRTALTLAVAGAVLAAAAVAVLTVVTVKRRKH